MYVVIVHFSQYSIDMTIIKGNGVVENWFFFKKVVFHVFRMAFLWLCVLLGLTKELPGFVIVPPIIPHQIFVVAYNSVSSHAKIRYPIASGGEFSPFKWLYYKKVFFLFLPSHPHKCAWNALFIGVSSVRVGVFYPHTYPHPHPLQNGILLVWDSMGSSKRQYLCYIVSILMLYCEYTYAILSVPGCFTFLVLFFWRIYSLSTLAVCLVQTV